MHKKNRTHKIVFNINLSTINKIYTVFSAKEQQHKALNSFHTSCRSISSIWSRSNGLYDGWSSTYDATSTWRSWFSSRLCTLSTRILWTSFVINSIIMLRYVFFFHACFFLFLFNFSFILFAFQNSNIFYQKKIKPVIAPFILKTTQQQKNTMLPTSDQQYILMHRIKLYSN